ncbi:hypothetical protein BLNAU_13360 [Blattamonas nauphoetae]|uniref:Uncharacterized protein n=1 Tax=Blattamonas nauphoetae TaxID=2049346 RepID=A0ABQ9XH26_9EUKA|nr:hypothetical protein BLNAU_13360 [Blattamonas nauphoetae]
MSTPPPNQDTGGQLLARCDKITRDLSSIKRPMDDFLNTFKTQILKTNQLADTLNKYAQVETGPLQTLVQSVATKLLELSKLQDSLIMSIQDSTRSIGTYRERVKDAQEAFTERNKALSEFQKKEETFNKKRLENSGGDGFRSAQDAQTMSAQRLQQANVTARDRIISFERDRLNDIKTMLMDVTTLQIEYYCYGLEVLTELQKEAEVMRESAQLETIQSSLATLD